MKEVQPNQARCGQSLPKSARWTTAPIARERAVHFIERRCARACCSVAGRATEARSQRAGALALALKQRE